MHRMGSGKPLCDPDAPCACNARRARARRTPRTLLVSVLMSGYAETYAAAHAEEETAERQSRLDRRDEMRYDPDELDRKRQARANYGVWGRRKIKGNTWTREAR